MRYNADGTPDTRFGNGSIARIDFGGNESFTDIALLQGGRILAGGRQLDGKWMLARFTVDGVLDTASGFGNGGIAVGDGSIGEIAVGPGNSTLYTIGGQGNAPFAPSLAGRRQPLSRHSGRAGSSMSRRQRRWTASASAA